MIAFFLTNWRIIAVILLLGSVYVAGRFDGASRIQARWDEQRLVDQKAAIEQIQKIQIQASIDSETYEKAAAKMRDDNQALQGRLKNVLSQNNALRACNADADFVSGYSDLTKETIH